MGTNQRLTVLPTTRCINSAAKSSITLSIQQLRLVLNGKNSLQPNATQNVKHDGTGSLLGTTTAPMALLLTTFTISMIIGITRL